MSHSPSCTILHISLFSIDNKTLVDLVKGKNLDLLCQHGGVPGVASALETDKERGIHGDTEDINRRHGEYGSNTYSQPRTKGLFEFAYEAVKDTTIGILLGCATLSLGFGIKEHGLKEGWYDGGSIFLAVYIVIGVTAVSNYRQSKQFKKLSNISKNIQVDVVRDGRRQKISIFDVVVGDVVWLKIGDQIPADGLLLIGHSLQVDESSMTGESDYVDVNATQNPFLFSGAKVADGYGCMIVTAVGMNTMWGAVMSSISKDSEECTPLQARLNKLTSCIGKIGLTVAFVVLVVLFVRYFTGHTKDEIGHKEYSGKNTKINDVLNKVVSMVAAAITIVVVAIPEGLPLAVTLSLSYSMKRMMNDQAMVRKLSACETMGSATTVCTDKTGTLTMNQMKVTEFRLGEDVMTDDSFPQISTYVIELLQQGVGLNTTASVYISTSRSMPEFSGSPTEKALISWAVQELGMYTEVLKRNFAILHVETFNSEKKRSGVLIRRNNDKTIHVHWKGAAEMLLARCSNYYTSRGTTEVINDPERIKFERIIENMAAKSLRCIAFAHKQIEEEVENVAGLTRMNENGLTLLGIVGIRDSCRPGVKLAVEACKAAGVNVKMITGDNIFTARAIAIECGILTTDQGFNDEAVIEGEVFRNYTPVERLKNLDRICVMARSSPLDKLLMVRCLKQNGHVVAVTGDGTNDAPALKEADIGLSMGIQGTEVAKESSDIIILDDNFTSIVTVLRWGRCVYNNIQKFIQFQLTVNITALVINFIAAISSGEVPLTTVQMLWVNLIMDSLGALALATERPTEELMKKPPVGRTQPLITGVMWKNLIAQALYQISVLLIMEFKGRSIFHVKEKVKDTMIFNTFVLCQVFNEFNARKLEKKNVFKGLLENHLFLGIISVTLILQVLMVEVLKKFADTERLDWREWLVCFVIAAISWPIGFVVKCLPIFKRIFIISTQNLASGRQNTPSLTG